MGCALSSGGSQNAKSDSSAVLQNIDQTGCYWQNSFRHSFNHVQLTATVLSVTDQRSDTKCTKLHFLSPVTVTDKKWLIFLRKSFRVSLHSMIMSEIVLSISPEIIHCYWHFTALLQTWHFQTIFDDFWRFLSVNFEIEKSGAIVSFFELFCFLDFWSCLSLFGSFLEFSGDFTT